MTDQVQNGRGSTPMERWFDHIVRAITVAAIIGGTAMLLDMRGTQQIILERIGNNTERISDLRGLAADRYTNTDALRDLSSIREELRDHETRLRALERPTQAPR